MALSTSQTRAMALGGGAQVICSFPAFLAGAMAVQISTDLGFGAAGLGLAIGFYHASAAASALPLGRMVDRIGARAAIRLAAIGAIACTLGIVFFADNLHIFTAFLMLAGFSRATAQPGANRLLLIRIQPGRLATAFGIKQSAAPMASMLAGGAVPIFALTVGWRWAYVLAAVFALLVLVAARPRASSSPVARKPPGTGKLRNRAAILLLGGAFGLSLGVAAIVTSFYVTSAVEAGTSQALAGWLLSAASAASIGTRLVIGVACDRTDIDPLRASSVLMGLGALGLLLLATGRSGPMTVGVLFAMGGSWGFAGAFWFAMVRGYADMPGRVTGALAPSALGGVIGPIVFGMLVEQVSFAAGWYFAATLAVLGAGLLRVGAKRMAAT